MDELKLFSVLIDSIYDILYCSTQNIPLIYTFNNPNLTKAAFVFQYCSSQGLPPARVKGAGKRSSSGLLSTAFYFPEFNRDR